MSAEAKHHLIFSIGPVQSYIAQARKAHDLYAGSRILSNLVSHAMSGLPKGSQVRFPAEGLDSMPNRFLAGVATADPQGLGQGIESMVRSKYTEMMEASLKDNVKGGLPPAARSQWEEFLQISWAALPEGGKGYHEDYLAAEIAIGAVKRLKPFGQANEPAGRKCGLCGERNALFMRPGLDASGREKKLPAHLEPAALKVHDPVLAPGEGLCAVCFGKRCLKGKDEYKTTAEVAMGHLFKDQAFRDLVGRYQGLFPQGLYDHDLLYEENIEEASLVRLGLESMRSKSKREELEEALGKVKDHIKGKKLGKLNKYYAVVRLDGDGMGRLLSGEFLADKGKLAEFHGVLSKALAGFATAAQEGFRRHGQVIYAGGDDFLALASLHELPAALQMLHDAFRDNVSAQIGPMLVPDAKATASMGVAIAHYKAPLARALEASLAAERAAKGREGKNALGVRVIRHSGGETSTVLSLPDGIEMINRMAGALRRGDYSNSFIGGLERSIMKLTGVRQSGGGGDPEPVADGMLDLLMLEAGLLANRSCGLKDEKERAEVVASLISDLKGLTEITGDGKGKFLPGSYLAALDTIDFLKREA